MAPASSLADPAVLDQFGNPMATQPSYTWSATTLPSGAQAPTFSTSGTTTTVVFSKAGSYGLKAYVGGASNLTFSITATVNQTLSSIAVSPSSTSIQMGATQQFTAQELDQFHNALATQPTFTWSASAGTITAAGLYTAPGTSGMVTVTAKSGALSGSASLTVGGSNSLGLMDQTLASLVQSLDADGSISRADMMQILRSVAANGTVGATDLADLRTIVGADAAKLNMPSYVQVLASDVVNGNPANAHYQGQALGNLAAGSTATQLNDLVNKWFLGTDLPNPGNSVRLRLQIGRRLVVRPGEQYAGNRRRIPGRAWRLLLHLLAGHYCQEQPGRHREHVHQQRRRDLYRPLLHRHVRRLLQ